MASTHDDPVAIVDDDPGVRGSLKLLLEVVGYRVTTYASALAFLDARPSNPLCLIVDHNMPKMTGLELVAHLRAMGVDIPVLLITGLPSPELAARAAALGVERVLAKPFREEELLAFITAHY